MSNVGIAITVLSSLILGLGLGLLIRLVLNIRSSTVAKSQAEVILEEAKSKQHSMVLEAKEEAVQTKKEAVSEIQERRSEVRDIEKRVARREENADKRANNLESREKRISVRESEIDSLHSDLEHIKDQQNQKLETVAELSMDEAKDLILNRAEDDIKYDLALKYKDMEDIARNDANDKARMILSQAIQRLASDVVSEATISSVPIPSDDMKGRLIGREGRNIRAIEKATGVDLIIDDTPQAVTVSCFDPVRREIAKLTLSKLVADGRIHPARIEDMVKKSSEEVEEIIWKSGETAVLEANVRGLHPEIIKLLGRLKYRYSYGENVLMHSLEVSHLAGIMAAEVGANVKIAKVGGLLHDLGKALSHEIEGPHAEIGSDIAKKYKVSNRVASCIAEHHDDQMSSSEAFVVAAADALSAARPGSRRDTVENYVKRMEELEEVAGAFEGVEKCFAIQAGREVRIMVEPESMDDVKAASLARDVVKNIEEKLAYPGQIKVVVIREKRSIEYAR
jgi:ribonuclease Y